jgi:hypothetical protein
VITLRLNVKETLGGETNMGLGINDVVIMAVSFFLVAILGPIALGTIANATTTSWNASVITVFQVVLPIIWAIGVALKYVPKARGG